MILQAEIKILDMTERLGGFHPVLLDGKGGDLPRGEYPVFLTFTAKDIGKACNSLGQLFQPNITIGSFIKSFR